MTGHTLATSTLLVTTLVGAFGTVRLFKMDRTLFSVRGLVVLNYVLTMPISGLVHLNTPEVQRRGYYDLLAQSSSSTILNTAMLTAIGLVVLLATAGVFGQPAFPPPPTDSHSGLSPRNRLTAFTIGVLLLPVSILSLSTIRAYASNLNLDRILSFNDGLARHVYASQWIVWAVTLVAVSLLLGRKRSAATTYAVALVAISGISAVAFTWSGGRSILVTFLLPVLIVFFPLLGKARLPFAAVTAVAATSYIYALSAKRLLTQGGASITTSLDWEWGRFSMVGFSSDVVSREGLLLGETYLSGLNQFLAGILGLLGLTLQDQAGRGASQVAGEYILASTDAYIVPGLVSEALLNFGGVGAIIALAALGFASKWVQKSISECTDPIALLLWAYIGALLVFRTLNADSWSLPTYFLYSGAPLIAAFASTRASRSGHIASATQLMPSSP